MPAGSGHTKDKLPPSASSFAINLSAGIVFLVSVFIGARVFDHPDVMYVAVGAVVVSFLWILGCELFFLKVHKRENAGVRQRGKSFNKGRVAIKLCAFYMTLFLAGVVYHAIPEYEHEFYTEFFRAVRAVVPVVLVGGSAYIAWFDGRMKEPEDGLWHFGCLLLGRWKDADEEKVAAYGRSVLMRYYFIPCMFGYLVYYAGFIVNGVDPYILQHTKDVAYFRGIELFRMTLWVYFFFATIDVLFGMIGYVATFRAVDTHIRSTEPTVLGWVVCLICYSPFFDFMVATTFIQGLYGHPHWFNWFAGHDTLLTVWGVLTVIAMCLESFATMTFGMRFSNLTYRGLIATGPFRYTRHPQYVAKVVNRLLVLVPFLSSDGIQGFLVSMTPFCAICLIYYLRAKTEENHLSRYPEYVQYAKYIDKHGIFRFLNKVCPFLVFSEAKAKKGKLF